MRWLAAAMAISVAAVVLPAQASDELPSSAAGLAPLDDAMLAMMRGGAAAGLQLGANAEAGAQSVDLTATSSLQAVDFAFLEPSGRCAEDRRQQPWRRVRRHGRHDLRPAVHRH